MSGQPSTNGHNPSVVVVSMPTLLELLGSVLLARGAVSHSNPAQAAKILDKIAVELGLLLEARTRT